MYILIKDDVPADMVPLIAAHTTLATYLKHQNDPLVIEWVSSIFYKVVCKVNEKEFATAKGFPNAVVMTESALDNKEVAIGFKPELDYPKPFKFYKLYKV